ncbi:hypothetical protein NC652_025888 [Populus alba x Populus x berolinensis]|nr:hypothetical protein NC652_025888 [Populus alba x Populus x berolinensis]
MSLHSDLLILGFPSILPRLFVAAFFFFFFFGDKRWKRLFSF